MRSGRTAGSAAARPTAMWSISHRSDAWAAELPTLHMTASHGGQRSCPPYGDVVDLSPERRVGSGAAHPTIERVSRYSTRLYSTATLAFQPSPRRSLFT